MAAILVLLMFVVVQMIMILQPDLLTKYIVSMRDHGSRHAPKYIALTATTATLTPQNTYVHCRTDRSDDNNEDHSNHTAAKKSLFIADTKEHHNFITECTYDSGFCPTYLEP